MEKRLKYYAYFLVFVFSALGLHKAYEYFDREYRLCPFTGNHYVRKNSIYLTLVGSSVVKKDFFDHQHVLVEDLDYDDFVMDRAGTGFYCGMDGGGAYNESRGFMVTHEGDIHVYSQSESKIEISYVAGLPDKGANVFHNHYGYKTFINEPTIVGTLPEKLKDSMLALSKKALKDNVIGEGGFFKLHGTTSCTAIFYHKGSNMFYDYWIMSEKGMPKHPNARKLYSTLIDFRQTCLPKDDDGLVVYDSKKVSEHMKTKKCQDFLNAK